MKRIALLTVLLLVVGLSLGFAQEFKPSVAWSTAGSASLVWGYNLIDGTNGFDNSAAAQFTLTFVPAATVAKGADAPVYGTISLATTALTITDLGVLADAATGVTASIVAGPLSVSVYGAPGFTYGYAGYVPLLAASAGYATAGAVVPAIAIVGGTTIKYTLANVASFALNLGSIGDWGVAADTASTTTYSVWIGTGTETVAAGVTYTDSVGAAAVAPLTAGALYVKKVVTDPTAGTAGKDYAAGLDVSVLAVKGLTLNLGGDFNLKTSQAIFGAQAGFAMAPFSVLFGIDGTFDTLATVNALRFDMSGNATLTLGKETVAFNMYVDNTAVTVATDPLRLDVGLTLADAEGLVPGLNASVGVYAYDLLTPVVAPAVMKMAVGETASYMVKLSDTTYVKPYETVYYDLVASPASAVYLNIGAVAALFPNTTITVDWTAGAIGYDNNVGLVATDMAAASVLKITTTVSY